MKKLAFGIWLAFHCVKKIVSLISDSNHMIAFLFSMAGVDQKFRMVIPLERIFIGTYRINVKDTTISFLIHLLEKLKKVFVISHKSSPILSFSPSFGAS